MSHVIIKQSATVQVHKETAVPKEKVEKWRKVQLVAAGALALVGIAALIAGSVLKVYGIDLGHVGTIAFLSSGLGVLALGGIVGDDAFRKVPILFQKTHSRITEFPERWTLVRKNGDVQSPSVKRLDGKTISNADRTIDKMDFHEEPKLLHQLEKGFERVVTSGLASSEIGQPETEPAFQLILNHFLESAAN